MAQHATAHLAPPRVAYLAVRLARSAALGVILVTALVGVVVGAWLATSAVTGARIVVLKTGSMSPALPQGAAVVSTPVAAADLTVGDVVTVTRDGTDRPVTHRVVSVATVAGDPAARSLVLQGDANATPDVREYVVHEAFRARFGGPELGALARGLQDPRVRVVIWVGAAGAVLWALWPNGEPRGGRRRA